MARRSGTLEDRISDAIDEQAMFDQAGVRNARTVARAIVAIVEREFKSRRSVRPDKGGPTEQHPDAPYCKPDQSCCDFCCGN